ncbi:alkaline phosphatase family protein [Candidatus Bathyarchaeota archaeon]|nr:alkaline phosphatase family protein [Candidatus Bathyarchaeota archaeon]
MWLKARRMMLIGLDGADHLMFEKFCNDDIMPNIKRIMDEGAYARALPCPPCDTPTNWTTIATGALTRTHGITGFDIHLPGEPLVNTHKPMAEWEKGIDLCQVERLWDVAEKSGMRCLMLNYIGICPLMGHGRRVIVGGPRPGGSHKQRVAPGVIYTTEPVTNDENFKVITLNKAEDTRLSSFSPVLKADLKIDDVFDCRLFLIDSCGQGYDKMIIRGENSNSLATLSEGEWSDWIYYSLGGERRFFKLKLLELDASKMKLKIYKTATWTDKNWAYPNDLMKEIAENVGPYAGGFETVGGFDYIRAGVGKLDEMLIKTYFEHVEYQANYFADVASYLARVYKWDLLMTQIHVQDFLNHRLAGFLDRDSPIYDEERASICWKIFEESYRIMDAMIGRFLKLLDKDTIFILTSDHGAVSIRKTVNISQIFLKEGLLSLKGDVNDLKKLSSPQVIDWSNTRAYPTPVHPREFVWVNLKGREPHGVVKEGEEYWQTVEEIIDVLYGIRDPETNERVVELALPREDAWYLGLGGERTADVVYFMKPGYVKRGFARLARAEGWELEMIRTARPGGGSHGGFLPSAMLGATSNTSFVVMYGPGIKKGYISPRLVSLADIAPTAAYLLGLPALRQAEGRVLYEFLL